MSKSGTEKIAVRNWRQGGLLLVGLLSGLGLRGDWGAMAAQPERYPVAAVEVEDQKSVFAVVESRDITVARARISGTITGLAVDEGQRVQEGQVLATIRDPKLTLQLAALDARIAALEAQHRQAEIEGERMRQLRASGAASQVRLEDAQTAVDVLSAQRAAQQAERAVVAQQMAEGAVPAPAAGRVLKVRVVEGALVMPGETVAEIAADAYVLRLYLPERHARFLRPGDPVQVGRAERSAAAPGSASSPRVGTVRQVYPRLEGGQVVADAEVEGLGDYFVGERVRVLIAAGRRMVLAVPPAFVFLRSGVDFVQVEGLGAVVVQTGLPLPDGRIEILSGLYAGDVLLKPDPS